MVMACLVFVITFVCCVFVGLEVLLFGLCWRALVAAAPNTKNNKKERHALAKMGCHHHLNNRLGVVPHKCSCCCAQGPDPVW